ncbi:MAG TPA: APC family permease [Candidatus Dormibacteraeota bacterium]|jgi:APA family basic amino acid/polyamine antiporter|nr:APC family permease [Candidatus Dormibacteraeota bacterium]
MDDAAKPRHGRRPGDLRMVMRRRAKLPRTLGTGALFSACYGNVGSSIYYALGVTAAFALGLTPLALLLAGCIFVTTALNYAEGTAAMPHAGGSSSFARKAFNVPIGFIVGWIQLLNYTATVSISAYTAVAYLSALGTYVPALLVLNTPLWHVLVTVLLVGLLIVLNVVGIQESSVMNLFLALLDLSTQLVLVVLGAVLLLNFRVVLSNIHLGVAPTWGNFLASISLAMVSYTGIETISNMSEEARNPGRTVPRATFFVIIAVLFVSAFLPTIGMSVFPVHIDPQTHQYVTALGGSHWRNDPVSGIVSKLHPAWLAHAAGVWVAILAFTILVIATNAGLIGISRLSYSLASHDLFPRAFSRLHPRFKTPFVSIIVFGIGASILILGNRIDQMAAVYSLAATFAFCIAHLAVMRLRYVDPDLHRPFKMPLNIRWRGSEIPVLSVIGALFIGAVFTQLLLQNIASSTYIFGGWVALGVVVFILYRRFRKQPAWEPLERAPSRRPAPAPSMAPSPRGERIHVPRHPRKGG